MTRDNFLHGKFHTQNYADYQRVLLLHFRTQTVQDAPKTQARYRLIKVNCMFNNVLST